MVEFLHGVETIKTNSAGVTVTGVKSSVIGIVGTAPVHHCAEQFINTDEETLNEVSDVAKFGPNLAGYTIPQALEIARAEGAKFVVVVNVFDPSSHKTDVAAADLDITDDQIQLAHGDLITVTVKAAGGAGSALVAGTDFTVDRVKGLITILAGGALDGETEANVAYSYGDPSAVVAADVIGTVDGSGNRTGLLALKNSASRRGYGPKILEVPVYSTQASVVAQMRALVPSAVLRAIAFVDAPIGTTVEEAIEGRGPAGSINFNFSDPRVVPCFPHVEVYDRLTDQNVLAPLSTVAAAVLAQTDTERGFWKSPSNRSSKVTLGLEVPISASPRDRTADVQRLNANGIMTVYNAFGTGYRLWGNRSSAFPADASEESFITQVRISDQIDESIENAMLNVIDEPISSVIIEDILSATNAYIRTLISRGAVPAGARVVFNPAKNPPTEVAKGRLTFSTISVGAPPLEHLIFEHTVDRSLLANLLPAA